MTSIGGFPSINDAEFGGITIENFLENFDKLPLYDTDRAFRVWDRIPDPKRLLRVEMTPATHTFRASWDLKTGAILNTSEVCISNAGFTAKNSTSLNRMPGPVEEAARGSSSNFPFWPGGFEKTAEFLDSCSDSSYQTIPPGFIRGFEFGTKQEKPIINLQSCFQTALLDEEFEEMYISDHNKDESKIDESLPGCLDDHGFNNIINISDGPVFTKNLVTSSAVAGSEWVEVVDISRPMKDFDIRVPHLAMTWPFELDSFQKEAIWRLERNESVLVAAHTSSGKTVVAEYAIALSECHMTRAIYTSPVKALSNQKFREFKETFNDVGLITGDIQINPTATCLIMTTEILRSMLYCGSDIIREVEYVVFDEVHYINDLERGVVWEEVLILLPKHISIIMLSATVPNAMEFAEWVGRTKKRKIYVISTLKRVVPLEHYLYTGTNGKTRDERFLIQDGLGRFLPAGHAKAVSVKKERESKFKAHFGTKGVRADRIGDKNVWLTLIKHLESKDLLPVIAFTLSRNRCDQNSNLLYSLDLTTAVEKSAIHKFITRCVSQLKGSDSLLPQVLRLTELLKRGIGVHHSGVLPLLKEIVEMLFQKGLVKLLFATETFSMGVNMPARTVVFDDIRKHDGRQFRCLLPAEYIQMAGRAGRRGLDTTGTVIILCKEDIHELSDLHCMLQGIPCKLESKFRLTYSMMLNLLRVKELRVEDMLKRSFGEIGHLKKQQYYVNRCSELEKQLLTSTTSVDMIDDEFQKVADEYVKLRGSIWPKILKLPAAIKFLVSGRIIIINYGGLLNVAAIILTVDTKKTYNILMLHHSDEKILSNSESPDLDLILSVTTKCLYVPGDTLRHSIVSLGEQNILGITSTLLKIEAEKIIKDVKNRQIPRFSSDPPGKSTSSAIQSLAHYIDSNNLDVTACDILLKDIRIQDLDLLEDFFQLQQLRQRLSSMPCCSLSDFSDQFKHIWNRNRLQDELDKTKFLMSESGLSLHPEYSCRINVLRNLQYIDEGCEVQLKGRVACEMSTQHDLLVTELIFANVLTEKKPAEIAAILSCFVFQSGQKKSSTDKGEDEHESTLSPSLREGLDQVKRLARLIGDEQSRCGLIRGTAGNFEYLENVNFGLTETVYAWALGVPFSEIMCLTDVQEGIVVRTIQRLDEMMRDVKDAARVIGDPMLYQKMEQASTVIKRDIVFAASLYTQE